jgi:hypothetical protein
MRPSIHHSNLRVVAVAMLLVWIFTIGAGLANACLLDDLRPGPAPRDHEGRSASTAIMREAVEADRNDLRRPAHDDDDHSRSHQLHCQPLRAIERTPLSGHSADKSFDQDIIVASIAHGPHAVLPTVRRSSAWRRYGPDATDLPLFILFRRLIP